jgi:hypothetical protein
MCNMEFINNFVRTRLNNYGEVIEKLPSRVGMKATVVCIKMGSNDPYAKFVGKTGTIVLDEQAYVDVRFTCGQVGRFFTEQSSKGREVIIS